MVCNVGFHQTVSSTIRYALHSL